MGQAKLLYGYFSQIDTTLRGEITLLELWQFLSMDCTGFTERVREHVYTCMFDGGHLLTAHRGVDSSRLSACLTKMAMEQWTLASSSCRYTITVRGGVANQAHAKMTDALTCALATSSLRHTHQQHADGIRVRPLW